MRAATGVLVVALGVLGGCVTAGGGFPGPGQGGYGGSGVQWSGPGAYEPYRGSPWGYSRNPYGYGYGGDPYRQQRRNGGGRVFRPDRNVVCDRATETCYRGREIDASETRDYFGRRAARRVDRVRDQAGTNRIFRVDDDVVCNRRAEVCLKNGRPDRSETRDFFGKKAARRID